MAPSFRDDDGASATIPAAAAALLSSSELTKLHREVVACSQRSSYSLSGVPASLLKQVLGHLDAHVSVGLRTPLVSAGLRAASSAARREQWISSGAGKLMLQHLKDAFQVTRRRLRTSPAAVRSSPRFFSSALV